MASRSDSVLKGEYEAALKAKKQHEAALTVADKNHISSINTANKVLRALRVLENSISSSRRYMNQEKDALSGLHFDAVAYLVDGTPRNNRTEKTLQRDFPSGRECGTCQKIPRFPRYYFSHYSDYDCRDCYKEKMDARKSDPGHRVCSECEKVERASILIPLPPILIPDRPGYKKKNQKKIICNRCGDPELTHLPEQNKKLVRDARSREDTCLYCDGHSRVVEIFPSEVNVIRVFCHYCKDSEKRAKTRLKTITENKKREVERLEKKVKLAKENTKKERHKHREASNKAGDLKEIFTSADMALRRSTNDLETKERLWNKRIAEKEKRKRKAETKAKAEKKEKQVRAKKKADDKKAAAKKKADDEKAAAKKKGDDKKAEAKRNLGFMKIDPKLVAKIDDLGDVDLDAVARIQNAGWADTTHMDNVVNCILNHKRKDKLTFEQGEYLYLHREHTELLTAVAGGKKTFSWAKRLLDSGFSNSPKATEAVLEGVPEDTARINWPEVGPEPKKLHRPASKPSPGHRPKPKASPKPSKKNGGSQTRRPNRFSKQRDKE